MKDEALKQLLHYQSMVNKMVKLAKDGKIETHKVNKPIPVKPRAWEASFGDDKVIFKAFK